MLNQSLTLLTLSLILAMLVGCKDIPSTDSITNTAAPTTTLPTTVAPSQPDQIMPSQPTESIATLAATYRFNSYYLDIANDGHFELSTNQIIWAYDGKFAKYVGQEPCQVSGRIDSISFEAGTDVEWVILHVTLGNHTNYPHTIGCSVTTTNQLQFYRDPKSPNCINTSVIGAISTGGLGFQNITYCK